MTSLQTLLTMSIQGSLMGLMVLLLRWLTRGWRLHRAALVWLWALVALRLVCPFGLNASFGLSHAPTRIYDGLLGAQTVTLPENAGVQQSAQQDTLQSSPSGGGLQYGVGQPATAPELVHSTTQTVTIRPYVSPEKSNLLLWIWGMVALAFGLWGVLSYVLFRRRLRHCRWLDVRLEESERVAVPCVVGVFHPRVYLPAGLTPEQQHHTVTHERCHIRRGDHIWKILAYGILALHWFNPLVWLFYFKFQRDVEMACDELVLRKLGNGARSDYSQTLLDLAKPRPGGLTTPVAFSENSIKSRLLQILKGGTPRSAVTIPAAAVCIALTLLLGIGATERQNVLNCNEDGTVTVYLPGIEMRIAEDGTPDDNSLLVYSRNDLGQIVACDCPAASKGYLTYQVFSGKEYSIPAGERIYRYNYDDKGRLIECYAPLGLESASERYVYAYDDLGRVVTIKQTEGYGAPWYGRERRYSYDSHGRLIRTAFSKSGSQQEETVIEYVYHEDTRQMEMFFYSTRRYYLPGATKSGPDGLMLQEYAVTTFDEDWRMVCVASYVVDENGQITDALWEKTNYFYDEAGRLIRENFDQITHRPYVYDGGDHEIYYNYDKQGNLNTFKLYNSDGYSFGRSWYIGTVDVTLETAIAFLGQEPFAPTPGAEATIDPRYRVIPQPGFKP